ncbi:MAG: histidine kinase [Planctomycetes bacterium]|nr:histidine kinase [Planctomycetota bacterium]
MSWSPPTRTPAPPPNCENDHEADPLSDPASPPADRAPDTTSDPVSGPAFWTAPGRHGLTLPVRLALAVTGVMIVVTVAADSMAIRDMRARLSESVASSLFGMVSRLAARMDDDLAAMRRLALEEAALLQGLDPDVARRRLEDRAVALRFAFDYGVLVLDESGTVVMDSENRDGWDGVSFADAEFFQRTFRRGEGVVSLPFRSPRRDGRPLAVVTAPLRDGRGRMTGLLAGAVDLRENRFLVQTTGVGAGRFGQAGVFTRDGVVVSHTDGSLVLRQFENPVPAGGFRNGGAEIEVAGGVPALLAVQELSEADWIVAGVFASVEVNAPIEAGFSRAHLWFGVGLALSSLLVWALSEWFTRDLWRLARDVAGLGLAAGGSGGRLAGTYAGEAGVVAGAVNSLIGRLDRAARDIASLTEQVAGAGERERRAIAADLHDSVCQTLALANLRLGPLRKRLPNPDADTIAAAQALLDQSVRELRTLSFSLSPTILYELGLVPALDWYARTFSEQSGIAVTVTPEGDCSGIGDDDAIFLYRAAYELLANVRKHAEASEATVRLDRIGDTVRVTVQDNGVGFPEGGPFAPGRRPDQGFGLRHLRERARAGGGDLVIDRGESGSSVAVSIVVSPA